MTIEATLNGILEAAITNVYGVRAPQTIDFPYSTFKKVSPGRIYSHNGYSQIAQPRYSITSYGSSYDQAKTMAAAIVLAVESSLPGTRLVGEYDDELDGVYSIIQDFAINYKEE